MTSKHKRKKLSKTRWNPTWPGFTEQIFKICSSKNNQDVKAKIHNFLHSARVPKLSSNRLWMLCQAESYSTVILKLEPASKPPGGLVTNRLLGLSLEFDSVDLGWGLRICTSIKFPVLLMAILLVLWPQVENLWASTMLMHNTQSDSICNLRIIRHLFTLHLQHLARTISCPPGVLIVQATSSTAIS